MKNGVGQMERFLARTCTPRNVDVFWGIATVLVTAIAALIARAFGATLDLACAVAAIAGFAWMILSGLVAFDEVRKQAPTRDTAQNIITRQLATMVMVSAAFAIVGVGFASGFTLALVVTVIVIALGIALDAHFEHADADAGRPSDENRWWGSIIAVGIVLGPIAWWATGRIWLGVAVLAVSLLTHAALMYLPWYRDAKLARQREREAAELAAAATELDPGMTAPAAHPAAPLGDVTVQPTAELRQNEATPAPRSDITQPATPAPNVAMVEPAPTALPAEPQLTGAIDLPEQATQPRPQLTVVPAETAQGSEPSQSPAAPEGSPVQKSA